MTDRLALPRGYRDQLEALLREHVPGVEVWAYGSRVNGGSHEGSDLDLVLRGPALEPLDGGFHDLLEAIEKSNIPILVQAHDWAMLPESFHREIERDYVVVQEEVGKQTVASGWRKVRLGDVMSFANGRSSPERSDDSLYPVYGSNGTIGKSNEMNADANTIVIGRVGSYCGSLHFSNENCWITDNAIQAKAVGENDSKFFFFLLHSLGLNELRSGSGQPLLNQTILSSIPTVIPPLPTQRAIAHILGTLDDKIELNRRKNETLEAMARALFKSWFVDFDPVRAKMQGRWLRGESLPGLPAEYYDLFPDRLVDSELGEIPEGWEVKALSQVATFRNGLALQKYPPTNRPTLPVIKIAQLRAGHVNGADLADSDLPPDYVVHDGDVLFSWSGSLELDVWTGGDGALNQHLFKVMSPDYPKWLCYQWVLHHLPAFRNIAADKATTMGHIKRHHLSEALTVIPDATVLNAMNRHMEPLLKGSRALRVESPSLAAQRDALLPRLVSGELRVVAI